MPGAGVFPATGNARLSGMANALRDCWAFAKISVGRQIS